ncbi:hypothetical protein MJ581_09340 [Escherichia coli]|nr:hypothetical protein MJ581_09340 [Escherichia coli]
MITDEKRARKSKVFTSMISLTMPGSIAAYVSHHAEHLGGRYHRGDGVAQDCNHASVDWQVVANGDVSVELRDADQQVVAPDKAPAGLCKW